MKIKITKGTSVGISVSIGDEPHRFTKSLEADQQSPKAYYVYAHEDDRGVPFYIGMGRGRRAWNTASRHQLWHHYVTTRLGGNFKVVILEDNMDESGAAQLENAWISQEATTLVNWVNMGRQTDYEALERFHRLRNTNRILIAEGRELEKIDLDRAIACFVRAIEEIDSYACIKYETGLVADLVAELEGQLGRCGELEALDRLTLCLIKLKRGAEARKAADNYFTKYRRDERLVLAAAIKKRVAKACRI
jgi:hypothetical protein